MKSWGLDIFLPNKLHLPQIHGDQIIVQEHLHFWQNRTNSLPFTYMANNYEIIYSYFLRKLIFFTGSTILQEKEKFLWHTNKGFFVIFRAFECYLISNRLLRPLKIKHFKAQLISFVHVPWSHTNISLIQLLSFSTFR